MIAVRAALAALLSLLLPAVITAQIIIIPPYPPHPPHPPRPAIPAPVPTPSEYVVKSVDVHATVKDQVATVQLSQVFKNTGGDTLEAQLLFPLPPDAAIDSLTLLVDGKELSGKLLKKDEARQIYESIVRSQKDPALLEYVGRGLYQTSVFPIPAGAERTVQIRYSQLLQKRDGLVDLMLPIGNTSSVTKPIEKLNIEVRIEAAEEIKTVYSPTLSAKFERPDGKHAVAMIELTNVVSADDFRLLYSTSASPVGVNVISYKPKDDDEGYFLLLASPEVPKASDAPPARTLLFVVDRSGSMQGEKMEQARGALTYLINRLRPEDTFNIIAYDSQVETFRPELQRGDKETIDAALGFAAGLHAGGSTNIDGALQTALGMIKEGGRPTYMLFLTDGLPTAGEENELKIAENVENANKHDVRLFSFGVGYDVNSRLLDRLSREQRGLSLYVRPSEDIEASVSSLYGRIASPALTDVAVSVEFDESPAASEGAPVSRMYPKQLADLFHGEQLVVVGRYRKGGAAKVTLTGSIGDEKKSFEFPVTFIEKSADESHGFVETLWATRRVGEIIDELDLKGQNEELVKELVDLSTRHGIMTPYTSFLAEEDVELARRDENRMRATELSGQLAETEGENAFNQRATKNALQFADSPAEAKSLPPFGAPSTPRLQSASPSRVFGRGLGGGVAGEALVETAPEPQKETLRRVGQKTFFLKNNRWQDSTVTEEQEKSAKRIVQYSDEYFELAAANEGLFAKYLTFDEELIVNLADTTYIIEPPK